MNAGLWIDFHRAVLVSHTGPNVDIRSIHSDLEGERWRLDVWQLPDLVRRKMLDDQLGRYYKNVAECILPSKFIMIFGPGNAKGDLEKQLNLDNYQGHIMALEPAGKMTDKQITAKVGIIFGTPKHQKTLDMQLEEGIASWCSPICAVAHRQPHPVVV